MSDDESHLPPRPGSGDTYYRRRIDELNDAQLRSLILSHDVLDKRVDAIDAKLNRIFGGLSVIVILASLLGPPIVRWLTGIQ